MPCAVLSEDEGKRALEAAGTDIKYLFSRHEVTLKNQKLFFHHGVTTLEKLSNFAKDRDDLATVLKDHWELDSSRTLDERVQVAAITCAYTNANKEPEGRRGRRRVRHFTVVEAGGGRRMGGNAISIGEALRPLGRQDLSVERIC